MAALPKWLAISLAIIVMLFSWQASGETSNDSLPDDESVNEPLGGRTLSKHTRGQECIACHKNMEGATPSATAHFKQECESCHLESGQSIAELSKAGKTVKLPKVEECKSCHIQSRKLMNWAFSVHAKAGGVCTDCHTIHASPVAKGLNLSTRKVDRNSVACLTCHQDVGAQFKMRSHHPVTEGGVSCSGCHDPHGSENTTLRNRSDKCLSCHQALRGPKVFEHAPVVEDCTNCHSPHGSTNRNLLSVSQPSVCLQCHSVAQGKHGVGTTKGPGANSGTRSISGSVLRGCTNCHGAIHGSQQDPLLRY